MWVLFLIKLCPVVSLISFAYCIVGKLVRNKFVDILNLNAIINRIFSKNDYYLPAPFAGQG